MISGSITVCQNQSNHDKLCSVCFSLLTFDVTSRVHEALAKTEERNGISVRWSQESPEYSDVSRDMQNRSMKAMQEQMRSQAVEYCYLKEISRKYSGMYTLVSPSVLCQVFYQLVHLYQILLESKNFALV